MTEPKIDLEDYPGSFECPECKSLDIHFKVSVVLKQRGDRFLLASTAHVGDDMDAICNDCHRVGENREFMKDVLRIQATYETDDECPWCHCGTLEVSEGTAACRGECGATFSVIQKAHEPAHL